MYCILLAYNSGVTTELGSTRVRSLTENLGLLLFCPPPLFMFNAGRVGEAVELPRVVISRCKAGNQSLAETSAAQGRNAGWQHMLGRTAVDTQGLAFEMQLAGVAGGAGDVQVLGIAAAFLCRAKPTGRLPGF